MDIIDAHGTFSKTFGERLSDASISDELSLPEPPFVMKTIDDLIADDVRDALKQSR